MTVYRLPPRFVHDHWERDLPERGQFERVAETRRYVLVEMDDDAYDDLLSDARHYADGNMALDPAHFGLVASARATVEALEVQGRPS